MGIQKKKPEQIDNEEPPVVEKKPVGRPRKPRVPRQLGCPGYIGAGSSGIPST